MEETARLAVRCVAARNGYWKGASAAAVHVSQEQDSTAGISKRSRMTAVYRIGDPDQSR
jgi:hypothetical protein